MRDKNKYVDDFIESKLRTSELSRTPGDFTSHLMKRIAAENKSLAEQRKSERIVKYAIGSFSVFIIAFTVVLGVASTTGARGEDSGVGFNSLQTSNSLIEQLLFWVQGFFMDVLSFFGLSLGSGAFNIILIVALVIAVFVVGERLFIRSKLKQSVQLK